MLKGHGQSLDLLLPAIFEPFQTCAEAMERLLKAAAPAHQVRFKFQMCNHSGGKRTGFSRMFLQKRLLLTRCTLFDTPEGKMFLSVTCS